jgi:hypothetical protein
MERTPEGSRKARYGNQLFPFSVVEHKHLCKLVTVLPSDCMIGSLLINFSGSRLITQIKIQRKAKRMIPPHLGAGGGGCLVRDAITFHLHGSSQRLTSSLMVWMRCVTWSFVFTAELRSGQVALQCGHQSCCLSIGVGLAKAL